MPWWIAVSLRIACTYCQFMLKCHNFSSCLSQDCRGSLKSWELSNVLLWHGRGTWVCWTLLVSTNIIEGTWATFGHCLSLIMSWRVAWSPLVPKAATHCWYVRKTCRTFVIVVCILNCVSILSLCQWHTPVAGGTLLILLNIRQGRMGSVEVVESCWTPYGSFYGLHEILASLVKHGRPVGGWLYLGLFMLGC